MGWRRGQAYSEDLRQRVLAAVDAGMAVRKAAALFRVSVAYIYKAVIRRRRTGEVTARRQRGHQQLKLTPFFDALRVAVAARPDATIAELRAWLVATHGVSISHAGLWTTLDRLGLSLKKRLRTRPNRSVPTSPPRASLGAASKLV